MVFELVFKVCSITLKKKNWLTFRDLWKEELGVWWTWGFQDVLGTRYIMALHVQSAKKNDICVSHGV